MAHLPSALLALALLLPLTACDDAEPSLRASAFEATVSGARNTSFSGTNAYTSTTSRGLPSLWLMLVRENPAEGGVSFTRAGDLTLRPGTFAVNTEAALNGGFAAYLTLPAGPDRVETFWAYEGTLTVTSVAGGVAEGAFSFHAGPGPGGVEPEVVAEGSFTAALGDE